MGDKMGVLLYFDRQQRFQSLDTPDCRDWRYRDFGIMSLRR